MEMTMTSIESEKRINPAHAIKLFSGRSNSKLAQEIADYLGTTIGPILIKNFAQARQSFHD